MLPNFSRRSPQGHNEHVTNDTSEFSFLAGQAAALGTAELPAERLTLTLEDGREISALRWGADDPVVTLVHGAGLNAHTWDNTALLLGLPALALDLPGHGDSSWRSDADYSPHTLAPDVAVALRAWTNRPQVLVGHSLGGLVSAAVAAAHPELVRALLLVDIAPGIDLSAGPSALREFYTVTEFASRDEMVDRAMAFGFGGARADTERGVFHNSRVTPDGRVQWKHHFAHLAAQTLTASPAPVAPLRDDAAWADLAALRAPLTLIRADAGYVSEANARAFAERLPDATVTIVASGHNVQENAPAALAELIRSHAGGGD